jgi:hypothetical protein
MADLASGDALRAAHHDEFYAVYDRHKAALAAAARGNGRPLFLTYSTYRISGVF